MRSEIDFMAVKVEACWQRSSEVKATKDLGTFGDRTGSLKTDSKESRNRVPAGFLCYLS